MPTSTSMSDSTSSPAPTLAAESGSWTIADPLALASASNPESVEQGKLCLHKIIARADLIVIG
jgi:hypothetical protein